MSQKNLGKGHTKWQRYLSVRTKSMAQTREGVPMQGNSILTAAVAHLFFCSLTNRGHTSTATDPGTPQAENKARRSPAPRHMRKLPGPPNTEGMELNPKRPLQAVGPTGRAKPSAPASPHSPATSHQATPEHQANA